MLRLSNCSSNKVRCIHTNWANEGMIFHIMTISKTIAKRFHIWDLPSLNFLKYNT